MTGPASQHPAVNEAASGGVGALLSAALVEPLPAARAGDAALTLGVLPGEGVGPELIDAALMVLDAVREGVGLQNVQVERGGVIGLDAEALHGKPLTEEICAFCQEVFDRRGVILCGPGGGRFVYDLRRRFDLYCKFSPVRPTAVQQRMSRVRPTENSAADILFVRDNVSGLYQGRSTPSHDTTLGRVVEHTFAYDEYRFARLARAAARMAAHRRGELTCVIKDGALPQLSELWRDVARSAADDAGVACAMIDIDYAAYRIIQQPNAFDVVLAPNMFGDILIDISAVLLGSRGVAFSGNFSPAGCAVYQTNHGAAYDLAGTDRANPVAQIFALAIALRESFGLSDQAGRIEQAVEDVWADGWRTEDLATSDSRVVGTRAFTEHVCERLRG